MINENLPVNLLYQRLLQITYYEQDGINLI